MAILLTLLPATTPTTHQALPSASARMGETALLPQPPLHSRAALDAYLSAHVGTLTPLDLLPPLSRQRFIASLVFGRGGLAGFSSAELAYELSPSEIMQVLTLFGAEEYAGVIASRIPADAAAERTPHPSGGRIEVAFHRLHQPHKANQKQGVRQETESLARNVFAMPGGIRDLSDRELLYFLRTLELASFDAAEATDARRLLDIVEQMAERGTASKQDYQLVHAKLVETRQFNTADNYARAHPDIGLPQLPTMVDALGQPAPALTVWMPSDGGTQMHRAAVDLRPTQILVTAGCHVSEDAVEDISNDPVLGPVFANHARWLMLPPGKEDLEAVRRWNRDYPDAPAQLVYERAEWTMLPDGWRMPTFFIVRDGKILKQISGWKRGDTGQRQQLIDALAESGLLDAKPAR